MMRYILIFGSFRSIYIYFNIFNKKMIHGYFNKQKISLILCIWNNTSFIKIEYYNIYNILLIKWIKFKKGFNILVSQIQ